MWNLFVKFYGQQTLLFRDRFGFWHCDGLVIVISISHTLFCDIRLPGRLVFFLLRHKDIGTYRSIIYLRAVDVH